jgi:hypothetical protein
MDKLGPFIKFKYTLDGKGIMKVPKEVEFPKILI